MPTRESEGKILRLSPASQVAYDKLLMSQSPCLLKNDTSQSW